MPKKQHQQRQQKDDSLTPSTAGGSSRDAAVFFSFFLAIEYRCKVFRCVHVCLCVRVHVYLRVQVPRKDPFCFELFLHVSLFVSNQ